MKKVIDILVSYENSNTNNFISGNYTIGIQTMMIKVQLKLILASRGFALHNSTEGCTAAGCM